MNPINAMRYADPIADIYASIEDELMRNIVRHLETDSGITSSAQWRIKKLAELGKLDKETIRIISQRTRSIPSMVETILTNAGLDAAQDFEPGFRKLVRDGILKGTKVPVKSTVAKAMRRYRNQALSDFNLVNTVMRYKTKNAFTRLITGTAEIADKQDFIDILQRNTGGAVTGAYTRQEALRNTLREFNARGIPAFVDKRGREWSPEAYVNMDIRATVNNVAHQTQFERMKDYGCDYLATSSHAGSRPKCAKDQGKIFCVSGKDRNYPAWKSSSYGEPDGMLGINCGHHVTPKIPGVTMQRYFPADDPEQNDREYKAKQKQRDLERKVKEQKRLAAFYDQTGNVQELEKVSHKVKQRTEQLKQYCADNGLPFKSDRVQVNQYTRSTAAKVTQAARR